MRIIRTALLLATGLIAVAGPATAYAGPGVTFYPKSGPAVSVPGGAISASANVPARTYTLPGSSSQPGKRVTLRGLTVSGLLAQNGVSPGGVRFVQVVNEYGGSFVIKPGSFSSAIFSDDGRTTRFFRSSGGTLRDYVETTAAALDVSVDGGADVAVRATARPKRVKVGEPVTFTANVRYGAPGAQYEYEWDFGEGPVSGQTATYSPKFPGPLFAIVSVRSSDPDCATRCGGTDRVAVEVGEAPERPRDTNAGGANGTPGGAGSAGGTGGGGQGGSGGGSGSGTGSASQDGASASNAARSKPESPPPPPAKPFGTTISGVLINDPGTTVSTLPEGRPAGAAAGVRAVRGGDDADSGQLAMTGLLALAAIWLGALRERRGVRLRVA